MFLSLSFPSCERVREPSSVSCVLPLSLTTKREALDEGASPPSCTVSFFLFGVFVAPWLLFPLFFCITAVSLAVVYGGAEDRQRFRFAVGALEASLTSRVLEGAPV